MNRNESGRHKDTKISIHLNMKDRYQFYIFIQIIEHVNKISQATKNT